ncbi:MAG: four helix bundle protein [Bacteroidota bacterium]
MSKYSGKYDLEERTARFGEDIIFFCKKIKLNTVSKPLVSQIVRSATSIGANYMEANGAVSKKDFRYKIHICKKEAQETKHWLRMITAADDELKELVNKLLQEAQELTLIFHSIAKTTAKNLE